METNTNSTNLKRLFLTFWSPRAFYSNPVRSFLQYFQESDLPLPVLDLPKNFYRVSEALAEDCQPLIWQWQLPDETEIPLKIFRISEQDGLGALVLDLGDERIADYLLGSHGSTDSLAWLADLMAAGGRMMGTNCAIASWEEYPRSNHFFEIDEEQWYWFKLPPVLWTIDTTAPDWSQLASQPWESERQIDGARLVISRSLPSQDYAQEERMVWIDSTQQHFLVPNNLILPKGELTIRNLDGEERAVEAETIAAFALDKETASVELQKQVEPMLGITKAALSEWLALSVEPNPEKFVPSTPLSESALLQILASLIGISPEQLNNPVALKEGLHRFLGQIKDVVDGCLSNDTNRDEIVRERLRPLQSILTANNSELGKLVEQFPDNLRQIDFSADSLLREKLMQMRSAIAQLERDSTDGKIGVGEILTVLLDRYREVFEGEKLALEKAQKEEEYSRMAKKSIEESFAKYPMPSLNFEDLLDS